MFRIGNLRKQRCVLTRKDGSVVTLVKNAPVIKNTDMDGNGRWAELRGLPRIEGHRRGAERSREVIDLSIELGIKCLTSLCFFDRELAEAKRRGLLADEDIRVLSE